MTKFAFDGRLIYDPLVRLSSNDRLLDAGTGNGEENDRNQTDLNLTLNATCRSMVNLLVKPNTSRDRNRRYRHIHNHVS